MNRRKWEEAVVFGALLAVGLLMRWQLQPWPNAFPALAVTLFAGFYFRSLLVAAALPLLVLGVTDIDLGSYDGLVQLSVYGMTILPVTARSLLRRHTQPIGRDVPSAARGWATILGCTWVATLAFYLITNFAVFLVWYDPTWSELQRCYVSALPFVRSMAATNSLGAVVLFGAYQWVLAPSAQPTPAVVPEAGK